MSILDWFIFGLPVLMIIVGLASTPRRLAWDWAVVTFAASSILVPLIVSLTFALANAILSVFFDSFPLVLPSLIGGLMAAFVLVPTFFGLVVGVVASGKEVPAARAKWRHISTAGAVLVMLLIGGGAYLVWSLQYDKFPLLLLVGGILMWVGIGSFFVGQFLSIAVSADLSTEESSETD